MDDAIMDLNFIELRKTIRSNSLFSSMLNDYVGQTDLDICDLERSVQSLDRSNIKFVSHRIKGGASLLNATDLFIAASNLESASSSLPYSDINGLIKEIKEIWGRVRTVILVNT